MRPPKVLIHELRMQVPGLTPEEARRLGETVAQKLSELPLSAGKSKEIPLATVRLRSSGGTSIERMADEVVSGIRRRLA